MTRKTAAAPAADPPLFAVVLKRPGVLRVGDIVPGQPVRVDAAEAIRLVDVKGLQFLHADDEARARGALAPPDPDEED